MSASARDAPHLMGLAYLQALARQFQRRIDILVELAQGQAAALGEPSIMPLNIDGIDYGAVTAFPDGTLDHQALHGVATDLRIRPFGWKGRHHTIAELCDEALQLHLGLQSTHRMEQYMEQADIYLGPGADDDPDGDGVRREITGGQGVLLATYLSLLPIPVIQPPTDAQLLLVWAQGRALFGEVGCGECHLPELRLNAGTVTQELLGEDPASVTFDLFEEALEPRPVRTDFGAGENGILPSGIAIYAFTDLRTHDMGPGLADVQHEVLPGGELQVPAHVWLTRPLWGLADTAPYMHDGRAPTVHDAIMVHGGEAAPAVLAYDALSTDEQAAIRVFLLSLTREPVLLVE